MIFNHPDHFLAQQFPKPWVFTNGCFDLLHPGHLLYLSEAKALGRHLIVAINTDESVKTLKGIQRPINTERDRATMLDHLQSVDSIIYFKETSPLELIRRLKPDIYVKGGDYTKETLPETPIVESYGGTVKTLSFVKGYSSSQLIERILRTHRSET